MKTEIVDSSCLSEELQESVKAGNPLIVKRTLNEKTGRMEGKNGRIIWDGKEFVFFPEKEKF